ncbi:MAG: CinA family protein, partial [Chitinophagaceae bacterium]|nr:CinA family protein [Chitinophagaceae bacterium]
KALEIETEHYRDEIAQRISEHVVSFEDLPLEAIVARLLQEKQYSIGLAESCTGGHIAHKLTQVPGSSQFFKGCIVCYATEIKVTVLGIDPMLIQTAGVVSETTARAMAEAARRTLNTDIGLGITGILSAGAYEDQSPPGTLFIALSDSRQTWCKKYRLHYDRSQNKETATQIALYLLWKFAGKGTL